MFFYKSLRDLSEEDTDPDRNRGIIVLCRKCLIRSSQYNEVFTIMSRNFKYDEAGRVDGCRLQGAMLISVLRCCALTIDNFMVLLLNRYL